MRGRRRSQNIKDPERNRRREVRQDQAHIAGTNLPSPAVSARDLGGGGSPQGEASVR